MYKFDAQIRILAKQHTAILLQQWTNMKNQYLVPSSSKHRPLRVPATRSCTGHSEFQLLAVAPATPSSSYSQLHRPLRVPTSPSLVNIVLLTNDSIFDLGEVVDLSVKANGFSGAKQSSDLM